MLRILLSIIFVLNIFVCPFAKAEVTAVDIVTSFGKELEDYCNTGDIDHRINIESLCNGKIKIRVIDDLIISLIESNPWLSLSETENFLLDTYLNEISKFAESGNRIKIDNIQYDGMLSDNNVIAPAKCVRYDISVNSNTRTPKKYTNIALVRDNNITAIYQYASVRNFNRALKMLFPCINDFLDLYVERYGVRLIENKANEAFKILRNIVQENPIGQISNYSRELITSMLIANLGCEDIPSEQKKYELACYFTSRTICPKIIFDKKYKICQTGTYNMGKFIDGETTESWKYAKHHPYMNSKGGAYLQAILPYYRTLSLSKPYVYRKKNKFGYKNGNKVIIPAQYTFAYPFDNNVGLAMIQNNRNKWGAINEHGDIVIPFKYDVVNDVFVNGKNFVISNNNLILIDAEGNELRKISGYNYLIHKLAENQIIAYNYVKKLYDAYDFEGNLIVEDCFPSEYISLVDDNKIISSTPHDKKIYIDYYKYLFWGVPYCVIDDINKEYVHSIWHTLMR
jgi:hypothetical protein